VARRTPQRVWIGVAVVAALLAAGLGLLYAFTPDVSRPQAIEGRPLLEQDGAVFTDPQVRMRFTPPTGWFMQARATRAPNDRRVERMLVKYKRLMSGVRTAWLRVYVADLPNDPAPAELLRNRNPPEPGWKMTKEIEDGLTVGGQPAARATYEGTLDSDVRARRAGTCEVVAVRHAGQTILFVAMFAADDQEARQQARSAIETATFD
jgi:hypothetical protein